MNNFLCYYCHPITGHFGQIFETNIQQTNWLVLLDLFSLATFRQEDLFSLVPKFNFCSGRSHLRKFSNSAIKSLLYGSPKVLIKFCREYIRTQSWFVFHFPNGIIYFGFGEALWRIPFSTCHLGDVIYTMLIYVIKEGSGELNKLSHKKRELNKFLQYLVISFFKLASPLIVLPLVPIEKYEFSYASHQPCTNWKYLVFVSPSNAF